MAGAEHAVELECSARRVTERWLAAKPLTRTNHCIALSALQGEATSPSSEKRLEKMNAWLGRGGQNVETLRAMFADRSEGLLSINRYLEDGTGTSTNACMIGIPARRELWACQGPSDRGQWFSLSFIGVN